jgi:hypothetical protein
MLKIEIEDKSNIDKITFYTFKTLNVQFPSFSLCGVASDMIVEPV